MLGARVDACGQVRTCAHKIVAHAANPETISKPMREELVTLLGLAECHKAIGEVAIFLGQPPRTWILSFSASCGGPTPRSKSA